MIEQIFQKEMILKKHMHQMNVIIGKCIIIGTFQIKVLSINHIFAMIVMI